ncbi:hypothetical protein PR048_023256, partial [Dryococelus australis]
MLKPRNAKLVALSDCRVQEVAAAELTDDDPRGQQHRLRGSDDDKQPADGAAQPHDVAHHLPAAFIAEVGVHGRRGQRTHVQQRTQPRRRGHRHGRASAHRVVGRLQQGDRRRRPAYGDAVHERRHVHWNHRKREGITERLIHPLISSARLLLGTTGKVRQNSPENKCHFTKNPIITLFLSIFCRLVVAIPEYAAAMAIILLARIWCSISFSKQEPKIARRSKRIRSSLRNKALNSQISKRIRGSELGPVNRGASSRHGPLPNYHPAPITSAPPSATPFHHFSTPHSHHTPP